MVMNETEEAMYIATQIMQNSDMFFPLLIITFTLIIIIYLIVLWIENNRRLK